MSKIILIITCLCAGILGGFLSQYFFYAFATERLVVNEIVLIDKDTGKRYGSISSNQLDGASGLILYDENEIPRLGSLITNGAPMFTTYSSDSNIQVALASDTEGANIFFYGSNKSVLGSLGYDAASQEGGLTISNAESTSASVISFYKNKPFIEVFNKNGTVFTTFKNE
ncbi:hypothetical protein TDB9533_04797 [Thalassocella blandensis]|nr:hypothetical protein TDB9533_04797 [Thalassocella blandensis]